jgi:hypothetical protein
MHANKEEASLELNQRRVIVLTDRDKQYTLFCRRIMPDDWKKYFAAIVVTSEQRGKERINVLDVSSPRLALAEAVLIDAEGYKVAGNLNLTEIPNWQSRIPLAHRLQLGETLALVKPSLAEGELVIYPEGEEIQLDAIWSAVVTQDGPRMQGFKELKHVLKTPTEAQYRRYSDESSRSRIIGGSRSSKTYYNGAQTLLAKLYDELVISVDGYTVDDNPLATPDQIVREMDMLHKVIAAQEIFRPEQTSQLAEVEDE